MFDALGMRRNSKLRKYRNARLHHCRHCLRAFRCSVELDHVCATFFHEPRGCSHGAIDTLLERTIWQVAADERSLSAPAHGFANDEHFVHGDFEWGGMSPQIDADGVSDRDDLHSSAIRNLGDLEVPGDDADDLSSVPFHRLKRRNSHFIHKAPIQSLNANLGEEENGTCTRSGCSKPNTRSTGSA